MWGFWGFSSKERGSAIVSLLPCLTAGNLDVMALRVITDHGGKAQTPGMVKELSKGIKDPLRC